MTEPTVTLKPCPFCGNDGSGPIEDALYVSHTQNDWHSAYDCYSVQCDKCTANMGYSVSYEDAIAAWNTRTASAPAGEVVAWMYECGQIKHTISKRAFMSFNGIPLKDWTETPLYAHPPAPADLAALRAEIERLTAEVRRLDYSTTHTCWDECPRLPCAQRREIEALTARAEAAEARNKVLEEALRVIRSEAQRENGSWVHIKRCIAVQSAQALGGEHD